MKENSFFGLARNSLSRRIFSTVLVFTLAIILIFSVVITTIYYFSYEREAELELVRQAQDAASFLNATESSESSSLLESQLNSWVRYTLIASNGEVLYDSWTSAASLDNHAGRPEVRAAHEIGQAVTTRYSETLKTDTVYAAVKLEDGNLIRLAENRHSLLIFLGNMLLPLFVALLIVAVLAFLFSRLLTKRIMRPIDALDFADPLENEIYEEMKPLLERIDDQQKQLKHQNKELEQAESLRRDFSSNVSHEMKTPLQVISGYAELMKNDMVHSPDRQKFAGLIYEEAQAMRSLIDDVLTLSRLDESAVVDGKQNIDLYAIAQRTIERLRGFAENNEITIVLEGHSAVLTGSETVAEQMIYNLLENGIRYNQPGGSVRLKLWEEGDVQMMQISDTGCGIPLGMQDKIFERFFRIDKSRSKETGGTGLGLAIVKHAVLYHQGAIDVESEPEQGTTFTIRFPLKEEGEKGTSNNSTL